MVWENQAEPLLGSPADALAFSHSRREQAAESSLPNTIRADDSIEELQTGQLMQAQYFLDWPLWHANRAGA